MGKTILVLDNGRIVETIDEEKWEGVRIENGRLVADAGADGRIGVDAGVAGAGGQIGTDAGIAGADGRIGVGVAGTGGRIGAAAPHAAGLAYGPPDPAQARAYGPDAGAGGDLGADRQFVMYDAPPAPEGGEGLRQGDAPRFGPARHGTEDARDARAPGRYYPWRGNEAGGAAAARRGIDPKKVMAVVLGLVLAAAAGFGGGVAAFNTNAYYPATTGQQVVINPTDQVSTTEAVAAKVIPSVVGITAIRMQQGESFLFGRYSFPEGGVGTGIIVDESGYILTNSHVVSDGDVDTLTVLLPDGREVDGAVLWNDRNLDLAIVKVEAGRLAAAELGDSDSMKIGSYVAAIGNPLGLDFRSSVSQGVISGLDRTIVTGESGGNSWNPAQGGSIQMEGLFQVDAAINSGNSGGPLLNNRGEVIGINTAKAQSGEGMGFAIPINIAKPIVKSVKESGEFHRVYLGISTRDVASKLQESPQSEIGASSGAYVESVTPGSPAEKAGILKDDIIVGIDGREIRSGSELIKSLLGYRAGDSVKVSIIRGESELSVDVAVTDSLE